MTTDDDKNSPPTPQTSSEAARGKHSAWRKILLFAAILILIAGVLAGAFWLHMQGIIMPMPAATGDTAGLSQEMAALEQKVRALDVRVNDLSTRVDDIATAPAAPATDTTHSSKTSAADLAHMQDDLATLDTAVNGLQAEMKQTANAAAAIQAKTTAARAETIAFVQLRDAAISGHSFTHELDALQTAVKNDTDLKNLTGKLAPFAEKGVPAISVLREQLTEQTAAADQAIAKAGAQTWWERVLAEFKGLVSIRPLHGASSTDTTLEAMQTALAGDDLDTALDEMKNLPPEAQKTLDSWRQEAEARQTVDQALQALADAFVAGANASAAPDAP